MRRKILGIILSLGVILIGISAQAAGVSAVLDDDCAFQHASFTVPAGKTAKNVRMTLSSSWLPCGGTGTPMRIGGRILGPTGAVLYYGVQERTGGMRAMAGNLAGLMLAPGTYRVEVRDGGKMTRAAVTYDLTTAPPPPAAPAAAAGGAGWGTISGDWRDPSVGSSARITQNGSSMTITNSFKWQGKTVTWSGSGTVNGNRVQFAYNYTGYKPEGWESGTMTLTRTNKKTLSGSWTTASGNYTQPITFVQTRSDDPDPTPPPAAAARAPAMRRQPARRRTTPPPPAAPSRSGGNCPPGWINGGEGRCMPPTIKTETR